MHKDDVFLLHFKMLKKSIEFDFSRSILYNYRKDVIV